MFFKWCQYLDYFSEKIEKLPEPATQIKCSFHFYRLPTAVGPGHEYLYYKKMKACLHLNNFRTKWEIVQEELYLFLTMYHLGLHLLPLKKLYDLDFLFLLGTSIHFIFCMDPGTCYSALLYIKLVYFCCKNMLFNETT